MGLNAALATAGQSLDVFSAAVQVAGQNVANASTPGYIRNQLQLAPGSSYQSGSLILGTGVVATGVQQQIDQYLEQRIYSANSDVSTATVKDATYKQLESSVQELGNSDLSTAFSDFFSAIQNVATQPESGAFRDQAVSQGSDLASSIRTLYGRVDDLRQAKASQVDDLVTEANGLIKQIQDLNTKVVKLESGGLSQSDAGDVRSQRYQALNRLSQILPIQYREQANGAVNVSTESDYLVLSNATQQLQVVSSGDGTGNTRVELSKTGHEIGGAGGELRGAIESRDDVLGGFLNNLDKLTSNVIYEFNKVQSTGQGLSGLTSTVSDNRVLDPNAFLNQADNGLTHLPEHGSFEIQLVNQDTGVQQTSTIPVNLDGLSSDSSLEDIARHSTAWRTSPPRLLRRANLKLMRRRDMSFTLRTIPAECWLLWVSIRFFRARGLPILKCLINFRTTAIIFPRAKAGGRRMGETWRGLPIFSMPLWMDCKEPALAATTNKPSASLRKIPHPRALCRRVSPRFATRWRTSSNNTRE